MPATGTSGTTASLAALTAGIAQDCDDARAYFATARPELAGTEAVLRGVAGASGVPGFPSARDVAK